MLPSSGAMQLRIQGPRRVLPASALHHGQLDVPEAHAAPLLGHVGQPQPGPLGLVAQLQDRDEVLAARRHPSLVVEPLDARLDRVLDEGPHPGPDLLVLGGEREVDGHVSSLA